MILAFLGPPGSGKGTQAKLLAKRLNIPHISLGDILRDEVEQGTEIGQKAKAVMNVGRLVPDELTIELTRQRAAKPDCRQGFILDGFPRSLVQVEGLNQILRENKIEIDKVVYFAVSKDEAVKRLLLRARVEGRADDNATAIRTRFEVYEQQTRPLIDYYAKAGKLTKIDAAQSIEKIRTDLSAILDGHN